jgi:hypothetical protein
LGQDDTPADQSKKKIVEAATAETTRSKKLATNVEMADEKRHVSSQDRNGELAESDEDGGDGTTSRGTTPSMNDVVESTRKWLNGSRPEANPSTRNLNDLSGMESKFIASQHTMSWCHMP